jgi:hypothetical protein
MVFLTKNFILNIDSTNLFIELQESYLDFLGEQQKSGINKLEIVEKSLSKIILNLQKDNVLQFIPSILLSKSSKNLIKNLTMWTEISNYDNETLTINWECFPTEKSLCVYTLKGSTILSQTLENNCNVCISVDFNFFPEFKNQNSIKKLFLNIFEKQIPFIVYQQMKSVYESFVVYLMPSVIQN